MQIASSNLRTNRKESMDTEQVLGGYKEMCRLSWLPIAPSYMSPNVGGVAGSQPMSTAVLGCARFA
jgi:hypothetical protein